MTQLAKNLPAMQKTQGMWVLIPGMGRSPGGGNGKPLQYSCLIIDNLSDFHSSPVVRNLPASARDSGLIPGLGRFHMPWSN